MRKWGLVRSTRHVLRDEDEGQIMPAGASSSWVQVSEIDYSGGESAALKARAGRITGNEIASDLSMDSKDVDMSDASSDDILSLGDDDPHPTTPRLAMNDLGQDMSIEGPMSQELSRVGEHWSPIPRDVSAILMEQFHRTHDTDFGFGPTLPPMEEQAASTSRTSVMNRIIEPSIQCSPPSHVGWTGSQKSSKTSSYGENRSWGFRDVTGMASQPPSPSGASFRTSIYQESISSSGRSATLFVPSNPKHFFHYGRVIAIPPGRQSSVSSMEFSPSKMSQVSGPGDRWLENGMHLLIVAEATEHYWWCISVTSYGGLGLTAPGLLRDAKNMHAIVHCEKEEPRRVPDEPYMKMHPIGLVLRRHEGAIVPGSRADFSTMFRVRAGVRLRDVGHVNDMSLPYLKRYFSRALSMRKRRSL